MSKNLPQAILFLTLLVGPLTANPFYNQIKSTIQVSQNTDNIFKMMGQGHMDGYFTPNQFWGTFDDLQRNFPRYLSKKFKIGETYEKRPIEAFHIGLDQQEPEKQLSKSIILFTGIHHAREPLSLSMMLNILGQMIYRLAKQDHRTFALLSDVNLMLIPIVNLDTYTYITKNYDESPELFRQYKNLRKSRRPISMCRSEDFGID
jgi:hypothetical protein